MANAMPSMGPPSREPIDLNDASSEGLQRDIVGIGPVLADRIVAWRDAHGPFARVDDLAHVPGIGKRAVEKLRPWLYVAGAPPHSETVALAALRQTIFASEDAEPGFVEQGKTWIEEGTWQAGMLEGAQHPPAPSQTKPTIVPPQVDGDDCPSKLPAPPAVPCVEHVTDAAVSATIPPATSEPAAAFPGESRGRAVGRPLGALLAIAIFAALFGAGLSTYRAATEAREAREKVESTEQAVRTLGAAVEEERTRTDSLVSAGAQWQSNEQARYEELGSRVGEQGAAVAEANSRLMRLERELAGLRDSSARSRRGFEQELSEMRQKLRHATAPPTANPDATTTARGGPAAPKELRAAGR